MSCKGPSCGFQVLWTPLVVVAIPYALYGIYLVSLAMSFAALKKRKLTIHRSVFAAMFLLITIGLVCIGYLSYLNYNTYLVDARSEEAADLERTGKDGVIMEYLRRVSVERVIQGVMVLANFLNNGILIWRIRSIWNTQSRLMEGLLFIPAFLSVANAIFGILTLSPFSPLFVPSTPTPAQAKLHYIPNFYGHLTSLDIEMSRSIPAMGTHSSLMRIFDVTAMMSGAVAGFMIAGRLFYVSCRKTRTIFLDSGLLYPTTLASYIFLQLLQSLAQARAWDEIGSGVVGDRERLRRKFLVCSEVVYHSLLPILGITTTMVLTRARPTSTQVKSSAKADASSDEGRDAQAPSRKLGATQEDGPSSGDDVDQAV
ncbi:hypothetical protein V5O48_000998 [Marasmius crinis-equi]|uniref:Uncharacterized protein n=1 Tax=Marasmius crinis-equi TaxID=585013 RepID=A0ABR3FZK3_9AGAR